MELEQLIKGRRTIHDFQTREVSSELVRKALEMGIWAPNHKLTCPWAYYSFSKVESAAQRRLLGEISFEYKCRKNPQLVGNDTIKALEVQKFVDIPELIWLLQKNSADARQEFEDYAAVACAVQNIGLYLWQAQVGCKWTTGPMTKDPRMFECASLSSTEFLSRGFLWIGYPAKVPKAQPRQLTELALGLHGATLTANESPSKA
jgi:nitroreductase